LAFRFIVLAERRHPFQGRVGEMAKFHQGQQILIPADVGSGPFPGEVLVTFETTRGPVSGFVDNAIVEKRGGKDYVRATVQEVEADAVTVWVTGSFFNTNGLAQLPIEAGLAA
jgi:hypothetical protein